VSDTDPAVAAFAGDLGRCLDADDSDAALVAFKSQIAGAAALARNTGPYGNDRPHALAGLAIMLVAAALNRSGRSDEVHPFVMQAAMLVRYPERTYGPLGHCRDLLANFMFLCLPLIDAAIACSDSEGAIDLVNDVSKSTRTHWAFDDPQGVALMCHPRMADYQPFALDLAWILDRQEKILTFSATDRRQQRVYEFEARYLEHALLLEQPARALPVIEARFRNGDRELDATCGHFWFNAVCVLAALGRFDDALASARALVRNGYDLPWRFRLEVAAEMKWTQDMRQNDWLGALAATPAYQAFLREDILGEPFDEHAPRSNPLCAVKDGVWEGKKKKRCYISRRLIAPGEPVVHMRRLFGHATDGDFDMAARDAVEASGWQQARAQFETDSIPPALLFPPLRHRLVRWHAAAVAAFCHDTAKDPDKLDVGRAVQLVASHLAAPIPFEWVGRDTGGLRTHAFEPLINDQGHGDAVNLTWRLLKAGRGAAFLRAARELPQPEADKLFAMLAVFDGAGLRQAAADQFAIPTLPAMMELAFKPRLSLDEHLALADFGDAHLRFRAGLAAAMRGYALHLYSNNRPATNWFLGGLEHFAYAHCCQLLFFLIHHPQDDDVLATMIETGWRPYGIGRDDAYSNAAAFYYRAAIFNRALHAPEQVPAWEAVMGDTAKDRETKRLLARLRRRK